MFSEKNFNKNVLKIITNIKRQFNFIKKDLHEVLENLEKDEIKELEHDANKLQIATTILQEQLQLAEKFLEKNLNITSNKIHEICHDLRNPVSNIDGYCELISEKIVESKKQPGLHKLVIKISKTNKKILKSILQISALTDQVLNKNQPAHKEINKELVSSSATLLPGRILIVDDDELNLNLMTTWLSKKNLRVFSAKSSREALALLSKHPEIDLILLDVMMKGVNGYETLKQIKRDANKRSVSVIMLSGLDNQEIMVKCIQEGAVDYLIKPFNDFLLTARIDACLEKRRLQHAEIEMKERLNLITNALPVLISSVNKELNFLFVNNAYEDWFNQPLSQIKGKNLNSLFPKEIYKSLHQSYERAFSGETVSVELVFEYKNSEKRYLNGTLIPHQIAGEVLEVFSIISDITQTKKTEEQLKYIATHDSLTKLPNRHLFDIYISHTIDVAKRTQSKFAILYIDVDNFKLVNDSVGHNYGDLLLLKFSEALKSAIRESDIVARIGGDEFILIIDQFKGNDELVSIATNLCNKLAKTYVINDYSFHASISIGVSVYPDDGDDKQTLIKNADIAMYHAKEDGKNNYKLFSQKMTKRSDNQFALNTSLRQAIDGEEFRVYFQPIVDFKTQKIVSFEALIRWQHPNEGLLLPSSFLHVAEETGLITSISQWLIQHSCKFLKSLQEAGFSDLKLNVNISVRQFREADFYDTLNKIIEETEINSEQLVLEVTESLAMQDIGQSIDTLHKLKKSKVNIVIDDFGTGFSCLSNLAKLPINGLKIDRSFVKDTHKPLNQSIISAVLGLAKNLNLVVTAEGVENRKQVEYLQALGCDYLQGFIVSPALDANEFLRFLQYHQGKKKFW